MKKQIYVSILCLPFKRNQNMSEYFQIYNNWVAERWELVYDNVLVTRFAFNIQVSVKEKNIYIQLNNFFMVASDK